MKNIVLFNNRSLHLYDFEKLRNKNNLRISAVLFKESYENLSSYVKNSLDSIYTIPRPLGEKHLFPSFPEEGLIPIIEKEISQHKDTWIVSGDEINNLTASYLREKFNLKGSKPSIILGYKNKYIQKKRLSENSFRIPKFLPLNREAIKANTKSVYDELDCYFKAPFILKPVDMFGAIGVEKIQCYDHFSDYFTKHPYYSELIAEEFITGKLYHCDFIIQNNKYIFSEVSEYLRNGLAFINGSNHGSLLLKADNPIRLSIINFCKEINSCLGLKSGCGHFEVFITNEQELIFLEAAARPAGSMLPFIFSKTFRNNFLNAALLAEIEEAPGVFHPPSEYTFWSYFPVKQGIVKSLNPIPLLSPYELEWGVNIGDILQKPSSIAEKSGCILVHNKDYEILKSDFELIKSLNALQIEES